MHRARTLPTSVGDFADALVACAAAAVRDVRVPRSVTLTACDTGSSGFGMALTTAGPDVLFE